MNKKRFIHLAVVLRLTPPNSPFKKREKVIHKVRGWRGYIEGFSQTSKREYGQWLLEIRYPKIGMTESIPLERLYETFTISK